MNIMVATWVILYNCKNYTNTWAPQNKNVSTAQEQYCQLTDIGAAAQTVGLHTHTHAHTKAVAALFHSPNIYNPIKAAPSDSLANPIWFGANSTQLEKAKR
jgi:hypothetical protein